jgi:hypothetical protein
MKATQDNYVSDVAWAEPKGKVMYDWAAIAKKLRKRPGEWARIFTDDRTSLVAAFNSNTFANKGLSPEEFEVRTENNKRGRKATDDEPGIPRTCDMFLRYVGPNKEYA